MQIVTSDTLEDGNREGEHILISLTYIGKNIGKGDGILLTRTLEQWRKNNEKYDITSVLAINENYFIQNIEGSRPVINEILSKLITEYSAISSNIVEINEIDKRKWNDFSVKYLTSSPQDEEYTLKNFSAGADFNPYLMKNIQITNFINDVFEDKACIELQVDNV